MSKSLYETLIGAVHDPSDDNAGAARRLLKALREPPPEITDAASWRAAIDEALAEADRLDAAQQAAKVADWTGHWPKARREIEQAGATVLEGESGHFVIAFRGHPDWCEIDLTQAEIIGWQIAWWDAWGFDEHQLDALARLAAEAIATYDYNRAKAARLRVLKRTHAWDREAKLWRPKVGEGPLFPGKVTLAEYEAAMSDRPQSV